MIWSFAMRFNCAIGLLLVTILHRSVDSAHALYTSAGNGYPTINGQQQQQQQQYQPLIDVAFPANLTEPEPAPINQRQSITNGWTPMPLSRSPTAQQSSVYTAINPASPVATPVQSVYMSPNAHKYSIPVAATTGSVTGSRQSLVNSTYQTSESISRNSYQKPQSTYMIQSAKYQQAFTNNNNKKNSTKSHHSRSSSSSSRKSSSSKNNKIINAEIMPIPMIKPHRHGATLGFNLPEQGLTLYLDINELATKPMAQNIGLKVVSHKNNKDRKNSNENDDQNNNNVEPISSSTNNNSSVKLTKKRKTAKKNQNIIFATTTTENIVTKKNLKNKATSKSGGKSKSGKQGTKSRSIGGIKSFIPSPAQANKARVLENPTVNRDASNGNKISEQTEPDVPVNAPNANINRTDIPPSASRIPATYANQVEFRENEYEMEAEKNVIQQKKETVESNEEQEEGEILNNSSKAEALVGSDEIDKQKPMGNEDYDSEEKEMEVGNSDEESVESATKSNEENTDDDDEDEDEEDEDTEESDDEDEDEQTTTASPTTSILSTTTAASTSRTDPETTTPWPSTSTVVNDNSERFTTMPPTTAVTEEQALTTTIPISSNTSTARKQETLDNELAAQMAILIEKSKSLVELSAKTCSANSRCRRSSVVNQCEPDFESRSIDSMKSIIDIARQLNADLLISEVSNLLETELQDYVDFSSTGYTVILPSNQAVRRLPPSLVKQWKENEDSLTMDAYIIEGMHTLQSLVDAKTAVTRNKVKLQINHPHNETYTINGQRVVFANQKAPSGGIIHVVDGLLYPNSDKDIMATLKACGRLDGFVTLAEGTGFADTLKQDGPFTVFVPSNDALQKVPDTDLELIRRNMTALREFLKYHVAQGSFYSQDLFDGQFLPSLLDGQYLQTGVRVDGCSRRLVEVNVSPLYRADIPASNGVIHVVDWILKPDDRDWCNGVILPRRK